MKTQSIKSMIFIILLMFFTTGYAATTSCELVSAKCNPHQYVIWDIADYYSSCTFYKCKIGDTVISTTAGDCINAPNCNYVTPRQSNNLNLYFCSGSHQRSIEPNSIGSWQPLSSGGMKCQ